MELALTTVAVVIGVTVVVGILGYVIDRSTEREVRGGSRR